MTRFSVDRLEPHDGDFGMSCWVECVACIHGWTTVRERKAGWFAIRAGERHQVDPVTHQHVHQVCAEALRAEKRGAA